MVTFRNGVRHEDAPGGVLNGFAAGAPPLPLVEPVVEAVLEAVPLTEAVPAADPPERVTLVIPTKNEASNIAWVLEQVPACVDEIVVVDGHSTDATVSIASAARPDARILRQEGQGKGDALRCGFQAATGEFVVMIDADGSMAPQEIPHFLYFLTHGYDFVKASRFMGGGGSRDITTVRRAGNRALVGLVNRLYGTPLTDLCYGYLAFRRRFLAFLDLTRPGFEVEAQLTISALRAGLRLAEVPSLEMPRRYGRSNLRTFHDGARVLRTIMREHDRGLSGHAVQSVRQWSHRHDAPLVLPPAAR